jgi:hypothetical protein
LPVRWERPADCTEFTAYLRWLSQRVEVIVVDGSTAAVFDRNAAEWAGLVLHLRPDPDLKYWNGKVNGVLTGMRHVRAGRVIIADDDVRYDEKSLRGITELLDDADLVVPQNYFRPLPWHARWDTGRALLNRALGTDFPGTLAVKRTMFEAAQCYDGDVLFENLELIRTIRAFGGRIQYARNVFIRRIPPEAVAFWKQRTRQAYDSLAQPVRLCGELLLLPSAASAVARGRTRALATAALITVVIAEAGRRRGGGTVAFSPDSALWAPLWLAERAVCSWLALGARFFRGGIHYRDHRLRTAAHTEASLREHGPGREIRLAPFTHHAAVADPAKSGQGRVRPNV